MTKRPLMIVALAGMAGFGTTVRAEPFSQTYADYGVGSVEVRCAEAGGWKFAASRAVAADGTEEMRIRLTATEDAPPPKFSVLFDVPQIDAHHKWSVQYPLELVGLPANWDCTTSSRLCYGMPLVAFLNANDRNRLAVACSEAKRTVVFNAGLREEGCRLEWKIDFFSEPEAPMRAYETVLRFDRRDVFFGEAIAQSSRWIAETAALKPAPVPAAAFEPLYSAWYSFHQNVSADAIEAECAEAVRLGMKTVIVDDGWQTDDSNRGYAYCGDWQVSTNRFPDFAAHVRKVHDMGLKYMIWYGVPMIGYKSVNYDRFKGKYLWNRDGRWADYSCLDPRFPEVREFLCGVYEKAMRDWNLDGLKLDFIDAFGFDGPDPAVAENYAGRDIKSLSEAIDRLMKDVHARLTAVKPDALVEFRQCYIGPGIRQYGNMLRATDCPGDLLANRCRIANLRLTSGETAVHADMLEWNSAETAENAARFVLSSIFGVIQYSVMLRDLPADHKRMIAHWLDFTRRHRETLLKGAFRPRHYEAFYPVIEAESAAERIVAVYNDAAVADCGAVDRPIFVLNATGGRRVVVRLGDGAKRGIVRDTFGEVVASVELREGLQDVEMPVSGYLEILPRPRIIFDTDMYTDYDDVGALAILHTLADAGECEIAAVGCNTWGEGNRSVATCEILNAYYGRPTIPVGCARAGGRQGPGDAGYGLPKKYAQQVKHLVSTNAPLAVDVYRAALSAAPDKSVVFCSVGFLNNVADLLRTDRELVERKVRQWVCMAFDYPKGKEYNSMHDPAASAYALANWPTNVPITFVDFPIGRYCYAGRAVAELPDTANPVRDAFRNRLTPRHKVVPGKSWDQMAGHPSWDEIAALVAVRGWSPYFNLQCGIHRMVGTEGENVWLDDPQSPNGRVTFRMSAEEVGRVLDELMCRAPKCGWNML